MKSVHKLFTILVLLAFLLVGIPPKTARATGIRYAMQTASGAGDCSSWVNACTLQTALTGATSGDEIWVAAGTYKPTTGTDRNASFQLVNGVAIYGGFAGTEVARVERDPGAHVTILSGDLNGDDEADFTNYFDNVYHVVTSANSATMDGFTVTAGNANGSGCPGTGCGGGMYNNSSSLTVANITFRGNYATFGGGMVNYYSSSLTVTNVTFNGNAAGLGGGIYNMFSDLTLTNGTFSGNTAGGDSPSIEYDGGGMYIDSSSPILTNVTFSGNSAMSNGGGLYIWASNPSIRNVILWGNTASSGAQIHNFNGSTPVVSDSVVQGGCPAGSTCTNIITADPLLGTLGDHGGYTQTFPLLPGSSAINATSSNCPGTDQRGVIRSNPSCDIGAYEVQTILLAVPGGKTSGSCEIWANACELQYALTSAVSGQEIWVAAGTYVPTIGSDRSATFQLKSGVAVYGGFAGTETARAGRDPAAHLTILSGDLNGDDVGFTNNDENVFNVVSGASGAILDGFTISAGNADGGSCPSDCGGGMVNGNSSSPTVTNIIFSGNSADYGGGMMNYTSSSPTLQDVTFTGNKATDGGGVYNTSSSNSTLINVTISGNSATNNGGGIYNSTSDLALTNVTISTNSTSVKGGGLYNDSDGLTARNVIFWENTAPDGAQIYNNASTPLVSDSVVQDGYPGGTNIITADPLLGTIGNYGGYTQTIPILAGSSAIDTGNDDVCPAADQRGVHRPQAFHCDIGAYEKIFYMRYLPMMYR